MIVYDVMVYGFRNGYQGCEGNYCFNPQDR